MYPLIFMAARGIPIALCILLVMIGAPWWVAVIAAVICLFWLHEAVFE